MPFGEHWDPFLKTSAHSRAASNDSDIPMLEAPEDDHAAGYDHDMEYELEEIFVQEARRRSTGSSGSRPGTGGAFF